jgi:hypothetical protein
MQQQPVMNSASMRSQSMSTGHLSQLPRMSSGCSQHYQGGNGNLAGAAAGVVDGTVLPGVADMMLGIPYEQVGGAAPSQGQRQQEQQKAPTRDAVLAEAERQLLALLSHQAHNEQQQVQQQQDEWQAAAAATGSGTGALLTNAGYFSSAFAALSQKQQQEGVVGEAGGVCNLSHTQVLNGMVPMADATLYPLQQQLLGAPKTETDVEGREGLGFSAQLQGQLQREQLQQVHPLSLLQQQQPGQVQGLRNGVQVKEEQLLMQEALQPALQILPSKQLQQLNQVQQEHLGLLQPQRQQQHRKQPNHLHISALPAWSDHLQIVPHKQKPEQKQPRQRQRQRSRKQPSKQRSGQLSPAVRSMLEQWEIDKKRRQEMIQQHVLASKGIPQVKQEQQEG